MPEDWDDHAGWERYYAGTPKHAADESDPLPFGHSSADRFAGWLMRQGYRRLWFPGCGVDGCPRLYASLGCEVWASDVSTSAVAFQRLLASRAYDSLPDSLLESSRHYVPDLDGWRPGTLHALMHDFREPFPETQLDCILNIRAYQALPRGSLVRAARVFFQALRPGGHAFFDTQNVQGERREWLEDALLAAGFVIPGLDAERRLRSALAETCIPHLFVMGRPFVKRDAERYQGADRATRIDADQATLRAVFEECNRREEQDAASAPATEPDPSIRTALVVYNTG